MQKIIIVLSFIGLLIGGVIIADNGMGESASGFLTSLPPDAPVLHSPADEATHLPDTITVIWHSQIHSSFYTLQVSTAADFSDLFVSETVTDTALTLTGLEKSTTYYWRVSASNVAGISEPSPTWKFTTLVALPAKPVLVEPENDAVDVPIDTDLKWNAVATAEFYTLQVSTTLDFSTLVIDQTNLTDSIFSASALENNTTYYWRVSACNVAGEGAFSDVWSFTTCSPSAVERKLSSIPKRYALLPAYPNPFNPKTTITYHLPEKAEVSLVIYNSIGQSVQELVSGHRQAGEYTVTWDGRDNRGVPVTSGLYLCHFKSGNNSFTQKILLMR